MKVLIWIGCILLTSLIVVALGYTGVRLGGIPTALLYAVMIWVARSLCKAYDEKHQSSDSSKPQAE